MALTSNNNRPSNASVVLGTNTNTDKDITITDDERVRHISVVGATGTGKSTLLKSLGLQAVNNHECLIYIDVDDRNFSDFLTRIPQERMEDVIYLDFNVDTSKDIQPTDRFIGITHLAGKTRRDVERYLELFKLIWKIPPEFANLELTLRASLLTLWYNKAALTELPDLLSNKEFRSRCISRIPITPSTHLIREFWEKIFLRHDIQEQVRLSDSTLNKGLQLLIDPNTFYIVSQETTKLHFEDIIENHKILLIRLSKRILGDETVRRIGAMILEELKHALFSRPDLPHLDIVTLICDEWQLYLTPDFFEDVLSQGRRYGVSTVLATQTLENFDDRLQAILDQVGTHITFAVGVKDAYKFAPFYAKDPPPELVWEPLRVPQYEIKQITYWEPEEAEKKYEMLCLRKSEMLSLLPQKEQEQKQKIALLTYVLFGVSLGWPVSSPYWLRHPRELFAPFFAYGNFNYQLAGQKCITPFPTYPQLPYSIDPSCQYIQSDNQQIVMVPQCAVSVSDHPAVSNVTSSSWARGHLSFFVNKSHPFGRNGETSLLQNDVKWLAFHVHFNANFYTLSQFFQKPSDAQEAYFFHPPIPILSPAEERLLAFIKWCGIAPIGDRERKYLQCYARGLFNTLQRLLAPYRKNERYRFLPQPEWEPAREPCQCSSCKPSRLQKVLPFFQKNRADCERWKQLEAKRLEANIWRDRYTDCSAEEQQQLLPPYLSYWHKKHGYHSSLEEYYFKKGDWIQYAVDYADEYIQEQCPDVWEWAKRIWSMDKELLQTTISTMRNKIPGEKGYWYINTYPAVSHFFEQQAQALLEYLELLEQPGDARKGTIASITKEINTLSQEIEQVLACKKTREEKTYLGYDLEVEETETHTTGYSFGHSTRESQTRMHSEGDSYGGSSSHSIGQRRKKMVQKPGSPTRTYTDMEKEKAKELLHLPDGIAYVAMRMRGDRFTPRMETKHLDTVHPRMGSLEKRHSQALKNAEPYTTDAQTIDQEFWKRRQRFGIAPISVVQTPQEEKEQDVPIPLQVAKRRVSTASTEYYLSPLTFGDGLSPKYQYLLPLYRLYYLTQKQVERLLGRSENAVGTALRKYEQEGLLERKLITGITKAGNVPYVYSLSDKGMKQLQDEFDLPADTRKGTFSEHTLQVSDALITLLLAAKQKSSIRLVGLKHERYFKQRNIQVGDKSFLEPDGFLHFQLSPPFGSENESVGVCLEIDLGSEVWAQWQEKIRKYINFASGIYQKQFRLESLTIAVCCPGGDVKRLARWTKDVVKDKKEYAELFLFTDRNPVDCDPVEWVTASVWTSIDNTPYALIEKIN